jgi:hypothetical protein
MHRTIAFIGLIALTASPALAQKAGKGGIGIDENTEVPRCERSLGTIALVEERAAGGTEEGLPPGLAAMMRMAQAQNGGNQRVDPLPLLKLLVAQSGCFQVVDRGEGFDALQRERQLAAGGSVAGANNQATLRRQITCSKPRYSIQTRMQAAAAVASAPCFRVVSASNRR